MVSKSLKVCFYFKAYAYISLCLIEVNRSPSWSTNDPGYVRMKDKLFNTLLDLVFLLHEDHRKTEFYL